MADPNLPVEANVQAVIPKVNLTDIDVDVQIVQAGTILYGKIKKYTTPFTTAFSGFKNVWSMQAAVFCLDAAFVESEDRAQAAALQKHIDAWLEGLNDPDQENLDDAGNALARVSSSLPQCSTANKKPLFIRPTHKQIIGTELTQDTASTGITTVEGEDER